MTEEDRKRLVSRITEEIDFSKKHISVLNEAARLLLSEKSENRSGVREMIKAQSANKSELRPALVRFNKLERALKKIDDQEFGICYICEQSIPVARLLEMPETTRCTKCEDK